MVLGSPGAVLRDLFSGRFGEASGLRKMNEVFVRDAALASCQGVRTDGWRNVMRSLRSPRGAVKALGASIPDRSARNTHFCAYFRNLFLRPQPALEIGSRRFQGRKSRSNQWPRV
jgi:hypothetical protein